MIEVKELSKYFGQVKAVDNISFNVQKGEILGFLGPNAAGKTTTMRIITGFLIPTSGTAYIEGINVMEKPEDVKKKIGYLAEDNPLYTDVTPKEYLQFIGEIREIDKDEFKNAFEKVISDTGIENVLNRPIGELSKGYRQRVGLAQALLHNPDILILDEPTTGLDPAQIVEIRNLIKKLGKEKTVILSTHILPEVEALCERVVIIHKGKIVAEGKPHELGERTKAKGSVKFLVKAKKDEFETKLKQKEDIDSYSLRALDDFVEGKVLFKEGEDARERFFDFCVENKWKIYELYPEKAGLEEIFLQLVTEE